jgi:PKD repeat protein
VQANFEKKLELNSTKNKSAICESSTLTEYQECFDGPSCPPGTIEDLEGITSARDAAGKLHVAFGFESAIDYNDKTFYMYMDDTGVGAYFTAQITRGTVPLTFNCADLSCGTITSWQLSFGDGAASNVQNPSHINSIPFNAQAMPGTLN